MRTSLPLALALLLVLAGCSSPLGGPQTESESVTPAAVPTDSQTTARPDPPTDDTPRFDAWLDAHWASLDNTTYAFRIETSIRRGDQEFVNQSRSAVVGPDRLRFLERNDRGTVTSKLWGNETHVVSLRHEGNETYYEVVRADRRQDDRTQRLLARLFEFIVVERIDEAESGYRVVGDLTLQSRERLIPDDVTVQNTTVRLDIREDGLIRSFQFGWSGTEADGTLRWSRGTVTFDPSVEQVPRPDWVDKAIGNSTVLTPTPPD